MIFLALIPIYFAVILPIAILSFVAKLAWKKVGPMLGYKPARTTPSPSDTTPTVAPPTNVIPWAQRQYDLVVVGATGFTGRFATQYLVRQYGKSIKWAVAGRNQSALRQLIENATEGHAEAAAIRQHVGIIQADTTVPDQARLIVENAKVVISMAGPFDIYGSLLVQMCALYGTHYCDITGESDWVRKMIDKYDDIARRTGARLVNFCGHDCAPWDLLVYRIAEMLKTKGERLTSVEMFDEIVGAMSGGTVATLFHSLTDRVKYKAQLGYDPLNKCYASQGSSTGSATASAQSHATIINKVPVLLHHNRRAFDGRGAWMGPFLMAQVMINCVRRSNAINGYSGDPMGEKSGLKYYEAAVYPSFLAALFDFQFMVVFGTCLMCPPLAWLLRKYVLPKPGQGPSKDVLDAAFLRLTARGVGSNGTVASAAIYFPRDPGYIDTARMLVESGLALALESDKINAPGGFHTPATCQKDVLLRRLTETGCVYAEKFNVPPIKVTKL